MILVAGAVITAYFMWEDILKVSNTGKAKITTLAQKIGINQDTSQHDNPKKSKKTKKKKKTDTDEVVTSAVDNLPINVQHEKREAVIKKRQKGMYYIAVARFVELDFAKEYCEILLRLNYENAVVIINPVKGKEYVVCIAEDTSKQTLIDLQATNPYRHGERRTWILE
jgi:cell division septation protein DedD